MFEQIKKRCGVHAVDALVLPKHEQILILTHKVARTGLCRRGEKIVVFGIAAYGEDLSYINKLGIGKDRNNSRNVTTGQRLE